MPADRALAAVILAAGLGTRLRPLTTLRPKALCPVGNVPIVDRQIARARRVTSDVAVNVHHHAEMMLEHLGDGVHISREEPAPLGTAGALGKLRDWIDGRPVLVLNADALHADDLWTIVSGPEDRGRMLVVEDAARPDFDGRWRYASACVLPWSAVRELRAEPGGLSGRVFGPLRGAGRLDLVQSGDAFYDCGTPREYHAANMAVSGGRNVVGEGATVFGEIERCVVWPGAVVHEGERLVDAIRAGSDVTVFAGTAQA